MLNPTLSKKKEAALMVNENAKKLFQVIYAAQNKEEAGNNRPNIKVSELISKMAFYYEKIRNTVDYKEESLHRKNAIERILKRQIIIQGAKDEEKMANHLLVELIRAGYLPNNKIEEKKISETGAIIAKYLQLKNCVLADLSSDYKAKNELARWIISFAASDIEEKVGRDEVKQTVIKNMYEILSETVKLPDNTPYEKDKKIQIYLGIHRNYLKFDRAMAEYILFKYFNANWQNADSRLIRQIGENIFTLRRAIAFQINHPLAGQLNRIIGRYTVLFSILTDVVETNPAGVYEKLQTDGKAFSAMIKQFCNKRYKAVRAKLRRAAFRSILYLLITKMILVFILEIPVSLWLELPINYNSLIINVSFPLFLLFLISLFTRVPSNANTAKIIEGIEEIIFAEKSKKEPYLLRQPSKRSGFMNFIFSFFYSAAFLLTFSVIIWALLQIHFNIISIIIFLFFLTLVSFFGIRIRKTARELFIIEQRENILNFITDFFYIPIIEVGKWLNERFSRINIFVFILDFIIEAPFKIFVEITEEWTKYVKERKDEIV